MRCAVDDVEACAPMLDELARSARAGAAGRRPSARRRRRSCSCRPAAMAISLPKLRLSEIALKRGSWACSGLELGERAVGRAVIDEDDLPVEAEALQHRPQPGEQRLEPALLVEHGHNHRERGAARSRWPGRLQDVRLRSSATSMRPHGQAVASGRSAVLAMRARPRAMRACAPIAQRRWRTLARSARRHDAGVDQAAMEARISSRCVQPW